MSTKPDQAHKFGDNVEGDETFIGAKTRNMHLSKKRRIGMSPSNSTAGKVAVMDLLDCRPIRARARFAFRPCQGVARKTFSPSCASM